MPTLRQNRCFLYHVIGNGTGDWDVPVGGMGASPARWRDAARPPAPSCAPASRSPPSTPTARCAGTAARRPRARARQRRARGARRPARRARPGAGPEGAQLKVNMLLARLPRLRDAAVDPRDGVRRHLPRQRVGRPARGRPRAGRPPAGSPSCRRARSTATRSPTRRSSAPSCGGRGRADADLLRAAHAGAAVPGRPGRQARAPCAATLRSLDSVLAEPIEDCLWRTPGRRPVPGGPHAGRAGGRARPARRATSSTATSRGRSPRTTPTPGAGASRRRTRVSSCAVRARAAAAASAGSPATTPRCAILSSPTWTVIVPFMNVWIRQ